MDIAKTMIETAKGNAEAELCILNAKVFNVFTGEFLASDVLTACGRVAAVLPAGAAREYPARVRINAEEKLLVPGFIDSHVHIESSHLCPEEFCRVLAARGVTTVVADPHEICNVMGPAGLRYMIEATQDVPVTVFFMLPSCVPAGAPETAAHTLSASDLAPWLDEPGVLGLGEMMNYPGVVFTQESVLAKLNLLREYNDGKFGPLSGLSLDGHAPFLTGADLQAYAAAGIGSDHESSTLEEARERLRSGIALMIREGSSAKNLIDLVPAIDGHTARQCLLCTDDRHVVDLVYEGSINFAVRKLVRDGRVPLPDILRMAGYNAARHFNLRHTGAVAPAYFADFALYGDDRTWEPEMVWHKGRLVAEKGRTLDTPRTKTGHNEPLRNSVRLSGRLFENGVLKKECLAVEDKGLPVKVIVVIPEQIATRREDVLMPAENGLLQADPDRGIAKLAVFERHGMSGRVGLGFLKGMGLKKGALASTVAHDSHNLIVMGMNDADMLLAVESLHRAGGGQAACLDGEVLALLPLPLAGLFSDAPAEQVLAEQVQLNRAAELLGREKGVEPLMTLSFMSLAVIPSLKLTDLGLVDVDEFGLTDLYCE
ncbi:MAG: adenine deaminase [Desulfovibrio sp.]|jgi:adenine deaminase|nr:adenine deaminase [Desulfovibrio sp.]